MASSSGRPPHDEGVPDVIGNQASWNPPTSFMCPAAARGAVNELKQVRPSPTPGTLLIAGAPDINFHEKSAPPTNYKTISRHPKNNQVAFKYPELRFCFSRRGYHCA